MNLKQFLHRWLARHSTGPNRLLHAIGIPATIVAVVSLFFKLWLLAGLCFVAGYVLQVVGHYLEGSRVGEVLLLKKIIFPKGGFARRFLIICLLLTGLVFGGLFVQALFNKYLYYNLYHVLGTGMYRSAQLPSAKLEQLIHRLGIKTVVNMRGREDTPWYTAERQVALKNDVDLIDLRFSACDYPSPDQLIELLDVIERIKPPFLVHCKGGSDRTGLFFVLLALREGRTWSQAMGQLSLVRFNHHPGTKSATVTHPLYNFAGYADAHDWPRNLKHFRKWLSTDHAKHIHRDWLEQRKR